MCFEDELLEMQALLSACDSDKADLPLAMRRVECEYVRTLLFEHTTTPGNNCMYLTVQGTNPKIQCSF